MTRNKRPVMLALLALLIFAPIASAQAPQTCILLNGQTVPCLGVLILGTPSYSGAVPSYGVPGPVAPSSPPPVNTECWHVGDLLRCRSR